MGQSDPKIFDKYYTSNQIKIDIQSAFLGCPTKDALVAVAANMGVTCDPRAPKRLDKKQKQAILLQNLKLRDLNDEINLNESQIKSIPMNQRELDVEFPLLKTQQKKLNSKEKALITRCVKEAEKTARAKFFATIHTKDIERQRRGVNVVLPPPPKFVLNQRTLFANIIDHHQGHCNADQRSKAISILSQLCTLRESTCRAPSENDFSTEEIGDSFMDDEFNESFPMHCPSYQCLFCLGDTSLPPKTRMYGFSQASSLKRHTNDLHLKYHHSDEGFECPHPICDYFVSDTQHFKNHDFNIHNVRL